MTIEVDEQADDDKNHGLGGLNGWHPAGIFGRMASDFVNVFDVGQGLVQPLIDQFVHDFLAGDRATKLEVKK